MNRVWQTLVCGTLVATLITSAAFAQSKEQQRESRDINSPTARTATPRIPADAPGVRLAGLIRNDGAILRNKGIAAVTKPARGIFCIKPSAASGVTPSNAVVQVTVDWSRTQYNEAMVQWASIPSLNGNPWCTTSQIEIHTLLDVQPDAVYTHSDLVSFSIIVP
jgi:hypothetical protein